MKKSKIIKCLSIMFLSVASLVMVNSNKVSALDYSGPIGYDTNMFRYLTNKQGVVVNLVVNQDGEEKTYKMHQDTSDTSLYTFPLTIKSGSEYYFNVCQSDSPLTCSQELDPFGYYINMDGTRNVYIDTLEYDNNWHGAVYNPISAEKRTIYAIDAKELTKNSTNGVSSSVFGKLTYQKQGDAQINPDTGEIIPTDPIVNSTAVNHLEHLHYSFLEIGNLYDKDNYFFINRDYSLKEDALKVMEEYKKMIIGLKSLNYNVILRTNFTNLSEKLKATLLSMSDSAIVDNKLNFKDPIVKRYILEVYMFWIREYKIDGFYIEDASNYDREFLNEIINKINQLKLGKFVYVNLDDSKVLHTSNKLQESLFGSLANLDDKGILTNPNNINKENVEYILDLMFGGNINDFNESKKNTSYLINSFGDVNGLDITSKLRLSLGISTPVNELISKLKLGIFMIFSSSGTPRIVSGNEFLNDTPIDKETGEVPLEGLVCKNDSICYAKGEYKNINWNSLKVNGSYDTLADRYRAAYTYQYPSLYTLSTTKRLFIDQEQLEKGLINISFIYNARNNGDISQSHLIINLSNNKQVIENISDHDYSKITPLLGSIKQENGKLTVDSFTFFTFSELKDARLPQWAYILIGLALLALILGIKFGAQYIMKKRGQEHVRKTNIFGFKSKQEKINEQQEQINKKKVKKTNVLQEFVLDDPMVKNILEKKNKSSKDSKKEESKDNKVEDKDNIKKDDSNNKEVKEEKDNSKDE